MHFVHFAIEMIKPRVHSSDVFVRVQESFFFLLILIVFEELKNHTKLQPRGFTVFIVHSFCLINVRRDKYTSHLRHFCTI